MHMPIAYNNTYVRVYSGEDKLNTLFVVTKKFIEIIIDTTIFLIIYTCNINTANVVFINPNTKNAARRHCTHNQFA